MIHISAVRCIY